MIIIKKKIAVRLTDDLLRKIDFYVSEFKIDSRNQFILDAIEFYIEQYQLSQFKVLPSSIETILSSNLTKLEQNVSSFLFKNAVETSMLMYVLASIAEIDEEDLNSLRRHCETIVKQSVGSIDLEKNDAAKCKERRGLANAENYCEIRIHEERK